VNIQSKRCSGVNGYINMLRCNNLLNITVLARCCKILLSITLFIPFGVGMIFSMPSPTHACTSTLVGSYANSSDLLRDVHVSGDIVYLAENYPFGGIHLIDVSNPALPALISSYDTPGSPVSIHVSGDTAYVAGNPTLEIIDVSNPSSPISLGFYPTGSDTNDVYVSGNIAYVTKRSGLQIIDVTDPTTPVLLGSYNAPGSEQSVFVSGITAYVASLTALSGYLHIIDVSNPAAPTLSGSYAINNSVDSQAQAASVFVVGNTAYLSETRRGGLEIIDISNPASPQLLGGYYKPLSYPGISYVTDNKICLGVGSNFEILDVSNPTEPVLLSSVSNGGAGAVYVSGNMAYASNSGVGLDIFNVSCLEASVPLAAAGLDQIGTVGESLVFGGSGSSAQGGTIAGYDWNFGDGGFASGVGVNYSYSSVGTYTATLTVTDNLGVTDTDTLSVIVTDPAISTLVVTPAENVDITAYQGSFSEGKISSEYGFASYIIENSGIDGIYSANLTGNVAWLNPVNHSNSTLIDRQQGTVTLMLTSAVNDLAPGTYNETVEIVHDNGGSSTTRTITLTVLPPSFTITPDTDTLASGPAGGPFIPSSTTYTITNTTADPLDIEVSEGDDFGDGWIALSSSELSCSSDIWEIDYVCTGTILPGQTADVTVTINSWAGYLDTGFHHGWANFLDMNSGILWPIYPTTSTPSVNITSIHSTVIPGETTTGDSVAIYPEDTSTGTSSTTTTISFDNVTTAGDTTVSVLESPPALPGFPSLPPPPGGFQIGDPPTYYSLETTAVFENATICIDYSGVSYVDESTLKLMHYNEASLVWEDVTVSLDTVNKMICGQTSSFSSFSVMESTDDDSSSDDDSRSDDDSVSDDDSASDDDGGGHRKKKNKKNRKKKKKRGKKNK